ncbi:hypothetical protein R3W88_026029 [Solanum pinnatisectum]|uniref:Cyanobacterial aminoacyl-tRNA synthetase CAAD domain-containing protein n=1 Tax=Solanum pinnatisectum TaxID=50273 RepID=A0AAV9LBY0_9SOLN|nr:hypothetical protein R3W88_026029 [Solanum pinnatisectum]
MASTTSPSLSLSSSSTLVDGKTTRQSAAVASSQCVTLPTLTPPPAVQSRAARTTAYCRKIARNVAAMATSTGEVATAEATGETATTELPSELVQKIQEVWDKVDDKYAVSSLGVAAFILLWSSTGVISAIDRLPLIPGVLELVGIGYTGWFAYKNLIFKPDREALIVKIKELYQDILGSS